MYIATILGGIVEMREDRFVERYVCITQTCRLYIVDQE